jgi:hypothetical protein
MACGVVDVKRVKVSDAGWRAILDVNAFIEWRKGDLGATLATSTSRDYCTRTEGDAKLANVNAKRACRRISRNVKDEMKLLSNPERDGLIIFGELQDEQQIHREKGYGEPDEPVTAEQLM